MLWLTPIDAGYSDAEGLRQLTAGRAPSIDLVISNADISTLHALFEWRDAQWTVRDLDSRNGTFINENRVAGRQSLSVGDEIRLGESARFSVRVAEPPPRDAPVKPFVATASTADGVSAIALSLKQRDEGGDMIVSKGAHRDAFELGLPFDLLLELVKTRLDPESDDGWALDAELRAALWGQQEKSRSSEAFYKHVRLIREAFDAAGLSRKLIQKQKRRTRITLAPSRLRIVDPG